MNQDRIYDTLHMGRSSIDLYANEIGAPFVDIKSFAAYVGGSSTNISVGARRLGLNTVLLTGVGPDPVGDFILNFLQKEGVETQFSPRKPGRRSSAVILGIEPPDKFPLVFYRDNCADIDLTIDDVLAAPIAQSRRVGPAVRHRGGAGHRFSARPVVRPPRLWGGGALGAAAGGYCHRYRG
jgi:5-dehydro-2-deoxygluconokinase